MCTFDRIFVMKNDKDNSVLLDFSKTCAAFFWLSV